MGNIEVLLQDGDANIAGSQLIDQGITSAVLRPKRDSVTTRAPESVRVWSTSSMRYCLLVLREVIAREEAVRDP